MGQVTIYLDSETERKMLNMIEKNGISKSKWIAKLIQEKTSNDWPENVKKLAGAWKDLPIAEEIRNNMGNDTDREPI
jgi:hypothetical protein